jgi:hypothetical protein
MSLFEPRQALSGGRTEIFTSVLNKSPGDYLQYADFVSLYPCVNTYRDYPVGDYELLRPPYTEALITDLLATDSLRLGMFQVEILPPTDLVIPVLSMRIRDKSIYALCRTCAETNRQSQDCPHNDAERALQGVWCSPELALALRHRYRLRVVHQVMLFDRRSPDLFKGYMKSAFRLKAAASGYPPGIETDEQRQEHCDQLQQQDDVQLAPEEIEFNPGKRAVAKTVSFTSVCAMYTRAAHASCTHELKHFFPFQLLNSLWGKFGQSITSATHIVRSQERLDALIDDPHLDLQSLDVNTDGSITIVVTPKDPSQGFNSHHKLVGLRSSSFNNFAIGEDTERIARSTFIYR